MRTTTLGSTGPEVGVIGLGCMGMTHAYDMKASRDDATSIAVIHQALDLGMTLIDTADVYGPYTNNDLPEDDFRRRLPRFQQDALRANLAIVDRVRKIAERVGATPAQVALAWVLAQGRHIVPIPGTKTPKYLADNAGAADIELSAADLAELDTLPAPEGTRY